MEILNLGGAYEPSERTSKKKKIKFVIGIGLLAGMMGLGSTLAASISLNGGSSVEFGQGVAATTACDSDITLTPGATFINSSDANFAFTSLILDGIDTAAAVSPDGVSSHCGNMFFLIHAYTASGATGTALDYAYNGSALNPLYLGWNYGGSAGATAFGGSAGVSTVAKYNQGFAIQIPTSGTSVVDTVSTENSASADAGGISCSMSAGVSGGKITCSIGSNGTANAGVKAFYAPPASAVGKITVESIDALPSVYSSTAL